MQNKATPPRILGVYDRTFWDFLEKEHELRLQCCTTCNRYRYPPAAVCPDCLSEATSWRPISGLGRVLSWTVFHRTYLAEYEAAYNVISVKLDEGPIIISNLTGDGDVRTSIDSRVRLQLVRMEDGVMLPRFSLVENLPLDA